MHIRKFASVIGSGILSLVALALSVYAAFEPRFPGDLPLAQWIQSLSTPWLDTAMKSVTSLGDPLVAVASVVVLAAGFALVRRWQEAVAFLGVLVLDSLLRVIKLAVDRARPSNELLRILERGVDGSGGSFPSGHAYHAVVFWGLLLVLVVGGIRPPWLRWSATLSLLAWILLSGVARVYVGAHWPSDVLGSIVLGVPSVALLIYLYQRLKGVGATPGVPDSSPKEGDGGL